MVYEKEIMKYEDLLDLPYPTESTHPRMPIGDRAAQFSPFAALTGYEDAVNETGRLTDSFKQMSEDEKDALDRKLAYLLTRTGTDTLFTITCFEPDLLKEGGSYQTIKDYVTKTDAEGTRLFLKSGKEIPISRITAIDCADFEQPEW